MKDLSYATDKRHERLLNAESCKRETSARRVFFAEVKQNL